MYFKYRQMERQNEALRKAAMGDDGKIGSALKRPLNHAAGA